MRPDWLQTGVGSVWFIAASFLAGRPGTRAGNHNQTVFALLLADQSGSGTDQAVKVTDPSLSEQVPPRRLSVPSNDCPTAEA